MTTNENKEGRGTTGVIEKVAGRKTGAASVSGLQG